MPVLTFDERKLHHELESLSAPHQILFAASCAGRLKEAFRRFSEEASNGQFQEYLSVFSDVWTWLESTQYKLDWENHLRRCLELMPADTSAPSKDAAYAEDGVAALAYSIRAIISADPQEAVWSARRAYEAADQLAVRTLYPPPYKGSIDGSDVLASHACQLELSRQQRDLEGIKELDELFVSFIGVMRERSYSESIFD